MGVFSRVRDIINANINAMLDRAEDPEKLIRLMIREMEDTLVEIKASCAQTMAARKKAEREQNELNARAQEWGRKAELAITKGRDDLAREALLEKRRYLEQASAAGQEAAQFDGMVESYQQDIVQLEEKLVSARNQQRVLVQRHARAEGKRRAQEQVRRMDTNEAIVRFEQFEQRIDRMEAEADLVNYGRRASLNDAFASLEAGDEIDYELAALKESMQQKKQS